MNIRNRIMRLETVRADTLIPDERNWRKHPRQQQDALRKVMDSIGFAGVILVREVPEGLKICDGHGRADLVPDMDVPVAVTDLDEDEAAQLMATFDPLAAMAQPDHDALQELVEGVEVGDEEMEALMQDVLDMQGVSEHELPVQPTEAKYAPPEDRNTGMVTSWSDEVKIFAIHIPRGIYDSLVEAMNIRREDEGLASINDLILGMLRRELQV